MKIIHLALLLYCFSLSASDIRNSQPNVGRQMTDSIVVEDYGTIKKFVLKDTIPERDAIPFIKEFYRTYTASFLSAAYKKEHAIQDRDLRIENYFTGRVIEKMDRVGLSTGTDAVIRAQDFNETAYETLQVKPLGDNWYMVSYQWRANDEGTNTNIPLKVILVDGQYMIDYITPSWNDSLYGDSLLCDQIEPRQIDNTSLLSFVETFYTAYLSEYGRMPGDLMTRLASLRKAHFTSNALAQFENASNGSELEGWPNYDLLIDDFDFDCLWIPSVTYTQIDEKTCQMRYTKWVTIGIIKSGGEYKIDSIRLEKQ